MNNGVYAAVLGSRMENFRMDVIANNLANADTVGFKAEVPRFQQHLDYLREDFSNAATNGTNDVGAYFQSVGRFEPGSIKTTGRMGDAAIDGDGFFVVQTPDGGQAFTRAGNFRINEEGNLTTSAGLPVMGDGGEITVGDAAEFHVEKDGTVIADGAAIGQLQIVGVENPESLQKRGANLLVPTQGTQINEEPEFQIIGEALEGSNVNVIREMTTMVTAGRQFEAYQRTIKMMDELNQRSTSLGRI
ncbi:MAG: flagellar basal-body rod protein FlgF [Deltaproteobacteria bacterium]|nr:flagellar basal-body rod protein FlgF [Deltaproteobacteria bacterium]MCB9489007.1 flagellar basal-body rod protein FlgF [Deltaproteobacteria bacterium]